MYLNADLISGTGAAEWARVRGTGSSKHEANSYYEFVTRLSIRALRLVNVPEFTSVFHALIQITSTWSLGHSCSFPVIVHFVAIIFFMWFPRALVWCARHGLESLLMLSRYWPGIITTGLLSLYVSGDALSASNITEVKTSPHSAFLFRPQDAILSIQTARCMYHIECQVDEVTRPWYGNSDSGVL